MNVDRKLSFIQIHKNDSDLGFNDKIQALITCNIKVLNNSLVTNEAHRNLS